MSWQVVFEAEVNFFMCQEVSSVFKGMSVVVSIRTASHVILKLAFQKLEGADVALFRRLIWLVETGILAPHRLQNYHQLTSRKTNLGRLV